MSAHCRCPPLPPALFIDFNFNISGTSLYLVLPFFHSPHTPVDFTDHNVTTANGETPTSENSKLINGVKGRGSIVSFNQAPLSQYAELGSTTVDGAKRGAQ